MTRTCASASEAKRAYTLVESLQRYFVDQLDAFSASHGEKRACEAVEWLREEGRFGGGLRYETCDEMLFNRGSVNISQIHYEGEPSKKLASATAISTIVHPQNPHLPSMHMHISWTQMKEGRGYWRIMADLNPSIEEVTTKRAFLEMLKEVGAEHYESGVAQGERYFYIPALKRHRGVAHFYLEDFNSGDFEADLQFARRFGKAVIAQYMQILHRMFEAHPDYRSREKEIQLAYHTLYLFQVLTLDRGTTSGLLVHDQNDIGILGSLPAYVDVDLLASWAKKVPSPQEKLVEAIVAELGREEGAVQITDEVKKRFAQTVRVHYRSYPEALKLQASGNVTPPTVENHR